MSASRRSRRAIAVTIAAAGLPCLLSGPGMAQGVPNSPVERAVSQNVMNAVVKAGIDLRTTPLRAITTADRMVYLTGPVNNQQAIKVAIAAASSAAPGYRVVTDIRSHAR